MEPQTPQIHERKLSTGFRVPLDLYAQNRGKLVFRMRAQLEAENLPPTGIVLLQGGSEQTRYCTDHLLLFRQESYFAYLFGVKEPEFYGSIDIATGRSILFMPRLGEEYAVWLGKIHPPAHFRDLYGVDAVHYVDEMPDVLGQLKEKGSGEKPVLYVLYGLNTDSGNFSKPATFGSIDTFQVNDCILHPVLSECRAHKSRLEIDVIRYANRVSSAAHVKVMRAAKPGMMEYQLESIFQHEVYFEGGCRHCSYTCICATGDNSAVLHYGHAAAPNDRTLEDGDMALLDMGAEYQFYASDITCSFPINGKFTDDQRVVYGAVLSAQKAVIAKMKPGVSWVDMHKLAEEKILKTLKVAGILNGNVADMMEKRLGAIFMPHGLGHFLGLDTHDPSGYPKGTSKINEPGLKSLRTVRTLEEGMVITVEPGCYFIDALLLPVMEDPAISKFFVTEAIQRLRTFGGVRLEDDVVVTADGCENLTNCPREIADVEAVMAGAIWPPTESASYASSASNDSPAHTGAVGLDHREVVWSKMTLMFSHVSFQLQVLKDKYLEDMKELYGMLTQRTTMPMAPEQLQKVKRYKDVLQRMIPYLTVPKERLPREFKEDNLYSFEKQIENILKTFMRLRQPNH